VLFERATFLVISHDQAGDDDEDEDKNKNNADTGVPSASMDDDNNGENQVTISTNGGGNTGSASGKNGTGVVCHTTRIPHFDAHRFEKISSIVIQFKLSCGKAQSQFQGMEVRNSRFSAFIDAFTANTYIMVIVSNPAVHTAATPVLNIQNARDHFEKFIPRI
jgi:hypothetical protein